MRTLLSVLAVGLLVLVAAPQNALACHQGTPHGNETNCDGTGAPGSGVFQFVGFTDDVDNGLADTIDGGQGMLEMNALCRDDFGPEARMCLDREFWLSPNAEAPATDDAWLHVAVNQSFTGSSPTNSCGGWSSSNSSGVGSTVLTTGLPARSTCNTFRPITCCAPAQ